MHILFIFECFYEKFHNSHIHTFYVDQFQRYFYPLKEKNYNFSYSVIMGDHIDNYWKKNFNESYKLINQKCVFDSWNFQKKYKNFTVYNAAHHSYSGTIDNNAEIDFLENISNSIDINICNFAISFFSKNIVLEKFIKKSIQLCYFSEGGITRPPFPVAYKFDDIGMISEGIASNLVFTNSAPKLNKSEKDFFNSYKNKLKGLLLKNNPFSYKINLIRKKYKYVLLLPLQVSGRVSFDKFVSYEHQIEYLYSVITNVPKDTALIITEHPLFPVLSQIHKDDLVEKFPFLIIDEKILKTNNSSLSLVPLVDGVINVSSSIGWLALILQIPLYVYGKTEFSFFTSNKSIDEFMKEIPKQYDEVLYYLIKNVWIDEYYLLSTSKIYEILNSFVENKNFVIPSNINNRDHILESLGKNYVVETNEKNIGFKVRRFILRLIIKFSNLKKTDL